MSDYFQREVQAAAHADRPRSRAPLSAGRQQEPQLRRRAVAAATRSAARPRSPSSRRRGCCRGSSRCRAARRGRRQRVRPAVSSVIHAHLHELFGGREIVGYSQFRVTRDADLWFDEEEVKNLRQALEGELPQRHFGQAVRLEVGGGVPGARSRSSCSRQFELADDDLYRVDGPVNLARMAVARSTRSIIDALEYRAFVPGLPRPARRRRATSSRTIRQHDILLHHPYQSFEPGRRVHPRGGRRPRRRRDQADGLPDRRQLGADGSADRSGAARQGSHRRRRADGALRRGGEHQLGRAAGARRRAGRLRRVRAEDAREARAADPRASATRRAHAPRALRAPRHRQLPSAHGAPLHRLRPAHRRPGDLRRRQRSVPAHHEPRASAGAHEAAAARAVHDAPARARADPARDAQRARRASRRASSRR